MSATRNILAIIKRELGGYFTSPVAYVFIVIFLFLNGMFTFMVGRLLDRGEASLFWFFYWHPWLYLVLVPAVGMGVWAEERRLGTIELLLTMPITAWQAIVGKFIAAWIFLGVALFLTFPVVISVNYLGEPDNGVIFCAYVGSYLLGGAYLAISTMTSAMTRNQVVSFILSVVICLFLILAGFPPVTDLIKDYVPQVILETIASFSVIPHFDGFKRGLLDFRDVLFFASIIVFGLFSTSAIIRSLRAGH